ncbi:MAG: hypothetical protein LBE24_09225 [Methylobacillus sp.]|jgi:hypothetical protein|nr:hypothetical protein [Methylobacillus sp.]
MKNFIVPICLSAMLIAACSPVPDSPATVTAASVTMDKAAVPARYSAPLPTSAVALRDWAEGKLPSVAPVQHVVDSIASGQAVWLERLRTAATAVPAGDAKAWVEQWRRLLRYTAANEKFCNMARQTMTAPASTLRLAVADAFAENCAVVADLPLIVRVDTPDSAIIEFYSKHWDIRDREQPPFNPRLITAVRAVIFDGDKFDARKAAFTAMEQRNPAVDAEMLKIHAEIKDPDRADSIAMSFFIPATQKPRLARLRLASTNHAMLCATPNVDHR